MSEDVPTPLDLYEYVDHSSWRCAYRLRYETCRCGLDELTDALGLPRVVVPDPDVEQEKRRADAE